MAASRWIFTKEELANTPSRKSGIDADKELSYRQQAATLIQDMGQRLSVTQLCINTAIVYMHRFYMFQTFARFVRNEMAPACLFLAAKVEEQPRKLEHVIKVAHSCLHRDHTPAPDVKSEAYLEQAQTLVFNENILLQTLGFDVTVDHPHTNVVKLTQLVKASKDLSQTSYFLATNSLHMTTFSLQYRPTVVACVCIYLACKWSNWKIPRSNEGKEWFEYIDRSVTQEMLEDRYQEFLDILAKYPHKLRKKIMGMKGEHTEGITNEDLEPSVPAGSSSSRHDHRKEMLSDFRRDGMSKRDSSGKERGDSHATPSGQSRHGPQERKDGHHPDKREQSHNRDSAKHKDVKDIRELKPSSSDRKSIGHVRSAPDLTIESRSHSNTNHVSANIPKPGASSVSDRHRTDKPVVINDTESSSSVSHPAQPQPNVTSDPHKSKSETLNYKEYLKRKEQEKLEREKYLKMKLAAENDRLNKTFSEGDVKQEKNRPPKLNLSLNNHEERTNGNSKRNERPYEVNIKSPIKPHHNIKVKSPIKSSDLKQPKLEITKVHITPEKDGSDACSVNINSDPNLKKMVDNKGRQGASSLDIKTETSEGSAPLTNHDRTNSPRVKVKPESPRVRKQESVGSPRIKLKMEAGNPVIRVKQEKTERLKEKDTVDSPSNDIELLPEHTSAPNFKIRELNYDPEKSNDSNASLKLPVKLEPGSGRSTPIISHIKSESGPGASPLKLKIITKGLKPDGEHSSSSSQHGSPHRRHYKHKHKSHKHSKDKHKDKHREHRDKHGTNGHSLKMSIKLSNIQGSDSKPKHDKHSKISVSDTSLNKNSNALDSGERQQPWSMTDLLSQSGGNPDATRKRRRTPTVDQNVDVRSQSKQARVETNRLRRSSSSHSVVSMELSDGEIDESSTNGPDSKLDPPVVNQLQERLQQMIDMTKRNVFALEQQKVRHVPGSHNSRGASSRPNIDRQQSGFDLEGMMWNCGSSEQPPLPPEAPPPLPMSPPPRHALPPPPPPM